MPGKHYSQAPLFQLKQRGLVVCRIESEEGSMTGAYTHFLLTRR